MPLRFVVEESSIESEPEGEDNQTDDNGAEEVAGEYRMVVEREVMPDGRSITFYRTGSG